MRESDHRGRENLSAPFTEAQASRAAGEARGTRPERVSPCILPEYKGIQASLFEPDKSDHPRLRAEVRLMEGNWLVPKKKKITNHDLFPYPVQGHNNSLGRRASLAVGNVFHPGSHFYAHFYDQSNTVCRLIVRGTRTEDQGETKTTPCEDDPSRC